MSSLKVLEIEGKSLPNLEKRGKSDPFVEVEYLGELLISIFNFNPYFLYLDPMVSRELRGDSVGLNRSSSVKMHYICHFGHCSGNLV